MKVITNCKVQVVGQTIFQEHPVYEVPDDGTDMERLGAFAAKSCYDSYGKDGRACVENQREVIAHKHGSVMEHSYASLFLEGITRALTLELNRHRPFNISQRSTRYVEEEDSAMVLEPYYADIWKRHKLGWNEATNRLTSPRDSQYHNPEVHLVQSFLSQCNIAVHEYLRQVNLLMELNPNKLEGFALRKWARGKARNVLPHALETRGTWTMNMRAWRWFIELRSNRAAEPEIRRLAEQVLAVLTPLAPVYFEDFYLTEIVDGIPEWQPKLSKV